MINSIIPLRVVDEEKHLTILKQKQSINSPRIINHSIVLMIRVAKPEYW